MANFILLPAEILAMPRTQARADEMLKYLSARIRSLGFIIFCNISGMGHLMHNRCRRSYIDVSCVL